MDVNSQKMGRHKFVGTVTVEVEIDMDTGKLEQTDIKFSARNALDIEGSKIGVHPSAMGYILGFMGAAMEGVASSALTSIIEANQSVGQDVGMPVHLFLSGLQTGSTVVREERPSDVHSKIRLVNGPRGREGGSQDEGEVGGGRS